MHSTQDQMAPASFVWTTGLSTVVRLAFPSPSVSLTSLWLGGKVLAADRLHTESEPDTR